MDELRAQFFGEVRPAAEADRTLLRRAFDLSVASHEGVFRKTGDPYIVHPIGAAKDVWGRYRDVALTAAALLHDTVEDCPDVSMEDIYSKFGDEVGFLVDSVTENLDHYHRTPGETYRDKIEKLLGGAVKDVRCLLLKIADRQHNLQTIEGLRENKQIRLAFETQAVYQPLKDILKIGLLGGVEAKRELFSDFLSVSGVKGPRELKEYLVSTFFHGFDYETFDVAYRNTGNIVWNINDKAVYRRMLENPEFERKIDVISLQMLMDGAFCCSFRFKGGEVFDGEAKMSVQNTHFR